MKKRHVVINTSELQRGFYLACDNATRFFEAACDLPNLPDKRLALAQLGQEEVGRSLTILAAFALPPDEHSWSWFWSGWRNHTLKAHRAYLYEMICPVRLEATRRDGSCYAGLPLREKLSDEKEAGFYVDFDELSSTFTSPATHVTEEESALRWSTLMYLSLAADAVRRTITFLDSDFRFCLFGELAFRICSEQLHQQDMPDLIETLCKRSIRHREAFNHLSVALEGNKALLESSFSGMHLSWP